MKLRLLGTFDGEPAGPAHRLLAQPKRAALLAYLLVERAHGPIARDTLLAMFWPELDTPRARNALNQALHFIRQVVEPAAIVAQGTTRLSIDERLITTDLDEFREAIVRGESVRAVELYRGDLLAGLHLSGCPEFERWLDGVRGNLRATALATVANLARASESAGDVEAELRWRRRLVEVDPLEEGPVRELATALERYARPAEALRVLDAYAERLREMGVEAEGGDASRLAKRLREAAIRPAAAVDPLPAPMEVPMPRPRRLSRVKIAAAVAALVLCVVTLIASTRSRVSVRTNATAVYPFEVVGDTSAAYLGEAIATLLTTHFDALGVQHLVSPQAAGARAKAGRLVRGRVILRGDEILLEARLLDAARGEVIAEASTTSSVEGVFAAADKIAAELAASLVSAELPAGTARVVRVASRSTASLPALRAYLDGERLRTQGRYLAATDAFLQATKLDPNFALAHYRLALVSDWSGDGEWSRPSTDAALANAERLTPRYRGLVSAVRAYMNRDLVQGERELLGLIRDYPDESEAWFLLGEMRFHYGPLSGRPMQEAKEAFLKVVALEPAHAEAMLHLARLAAFEGNAVDFARYAAVLRNPAREDERRLELDALEAFAFGSADDNARLLSRLADYREIEVDAAAKAVAVYSRDLDGAAAIALSLTIERSATWRARGLAWQAQLAAARGRWDVVRAQLDSVAELQPAFAVQSAVVLASVPSSPEAFARDAGERVLAPVAAARAVPASLDVVVLDEARRLYLAGLVEARLGDSTSIALRLRRLEALRGVPEAARKEYARSLEAASAYVARDWSRVATLLAPTELDANGVVGDGLQMGRATERMWRAQALACLQRDAEFARWRASFPEPAGYDLAFTDVVRGMSRARC